MMRAKRAKKFGDPQKFRWSSIFWILVILYDPQKIFEGDPQLIRKKSTVHGDALFSKSTYANPTKLQEMLVGIIFCCTKQKTACLEVIFRFVVDLRGTIMDTPVYYYVKMLCLSFLIHVPSDGSIRFSPV